jgi:hypothetical protein
MAAPVWRESAEEEPLLMNHSHFNTETIPALARNQTCQSVLEAAFCRARTKKNEFGQ